LLNCSNEKRDLPSVYTRRSPNVALSTRRDPATDGGGGHPEANRLAEYLDGVLSESLRVDVEHHLNDCAECRQVLADTAAFVADVERLHVKDRRTSNIRPFPWRRAVGFVGVGALAAAVVLLVVRSIPGGRSAEGELDALVAAMSSEPTRAVDGRLTGGFPYAPPPTTRGGVQRELSPDVRIAVAQIEKLAGERDTPADRAAIGVAYLVAGEIDKAVEALERASAASGNASVTSDLAAAYLARGSVRPEDLQKALDAAERSVMDPDAPIEAWFNRALALERLGLRDRASTAWNEYLERDPSSPWAGEARKFLQTDTPR
jgi:tetratricopeptide (TPR) repeat protein